MNTFSRDMIINNNKKVLNDLYMKRNGLIKEEIKVEKINNSKKLEDKIIPKLKKRKVNTSHIENNVLKELKKFEEKYNNAKTEDEKRKAVKEYKAFLKSSKNTQGMKSIFGALLGGVVGFSLRIVLKLAGLMLIAIYVPKIVFEKQELIGIISTIEDVVGSDKFNDFLLRVWDINPSRYAIEGGINYIDQFIERLIDKGADFIQEFI